MWLFVISSFLSFCIDYAIFNMLYYLTRHVILATIVARIISVIINYLINKKVVFQSTNKSYNFKNYVLLATCILLINCVFIYLLVDIFAVPAYLAKVIIELILYFMSYSVQNYLACKKA